MQVERTLNYCSINFILIYDDQIKPNVPHKYLKQLFVDLEYQIYDRLYRILIDYDRSWFRALVLKSTIDQQ
jgi:hypothetical protein